MEKYFLCDQAGQDHSGECEFDLGLTGRTGEQE